MIPGGIATTTGAGSAAAFPEPPTGSPGEIEAIARSLQQAATELEHTERGLTSATEALVADWSGYAANAYRSSSGALAAAARGASATVRDCAEAVAGYARALETTQTDMARLKRLYDDAKGRETAAAATATTLGGHLAAATKPAAIHQLDGDISNANHQAFDAGEEATGYAIQASHSVDEFHRLETRYIQTLTGGQTSVAGRSLPAGSPFAPAFSGTGAAGVGFGVPYTAFGGIVPGGLSGYDGVIPVGDPWHSDIPGYGAYLDGRTPVEPTDDLTDAITFVAAPFAGKAAEELLVTGGRAFMEDVGIGGAGQEAAARAGQDAYLKDFYSGDYRTGDPLNTAKMGRALQARQAGAATMEAGQEETQNRLSAQILDALDKADRIPPGVKEVAEHILQMRTYYGTRLTQAAQALIRLLGR